MWVEVAGAIALGWALARGGAPAELAPPRDEAVELDQLLVELGASRDLRRFARAKAYIESRGNPRAVNLEDGGPAMRAFERLREQGRLSCGRPAEDYAFSGGWFGLLPPTSIVNAYRGTALECLDPRAVFEPRESLALFLAYLGALQRRPAYQANPTWEALWLGNRSPKLMNLSQRETEQARKSLANFRKALDALGIDRGLMTRKPPMLSRSGLTWRDRLGIGGFA